MLTRCWETLGCFPAARTSLFPLSEHSYQMICKVLAGLMCLGNSSMHSLCASVLVCGLPNFGLVALVIIDITNVIDCCPLGVVGFLGFGFHLRLTKLKVHVNYFHTRPTITCIQGNLRSISIDKRISFRVSPKETKTFPSSLIFVSIRARKRVQFPIFPCWRFFFSILLLFFALSTLHANKKWGFELGEFLDRRQ